MSRFHNVVRAAGANAAVIGLLIVALMFSPAITLADIYKCTDEDGNLSYAQTPCPIQKPVSVEEPGTGASTSAADCEHASRFAFSAARLMQAGTRSDELFNRYGGLDSLSRGSIDIINYVYGYRTSNELSAERIAALTQAKCQANSFGDVSCERLPPAYAESIGGCNPGESDAAYILPRSESLTPDPAVAETAENETDEQCRKRFRDAIDVVEAEMFQDYSPDKAAAYRQRLLALTQRLRQC